MGFNFQPTKAQETSLPFISSYFIKEKKKRFPDFKELKNINKRKVIFCVKSKQQTK